MHWRALESCCWSCDNKQRESWRSCKILTPQQAHIKICAITGQKSWCSPPDCTCWGKFQKCLGESTATENVQRLIPWWKRQFWCGNNSLRERRGWVFQVHLAGGSFPQFQALSVPCEFPRAQELACHLRGIRCATRTADRWPWFTCIAVPDCCRESCESRQQRSFIRKLADTRVSGSKAGWSRWRFPSRKQASAEDRRIQSNIRESLQADCQGPNRV